MAQTVVNLVLSSCFIMQDTWLTPLADAVSMVVEKPTRKTELDTYCRKKTVLVCKFFEKPPFFHAEPRQLSCPTWWLQRGQKLLDHPSTSTTVPPCVSTYVEYITCQNYTNEFPC